MMTVYKNDGHCFKNKGGSGILLANPNKFSSVFLYKNIKKFGILAFPNKIKELDLNNRSSHVFKIRPHMKKALVDVFTKNQIEVFDEICEEVFLNEKKVFATPEGFLMYVMWLKKENKAFHFDVDILISDEQLKKTFSKLKGIKFIPFSLERLLKLFSFFYNSKLNQTDIKFISNFQFNLIKRNFTLDGFSKEDLFRLEDIINSTKNNHLPNLNLHNKIVEMIYNFKKILDNKTEVEFLDEDFVTIYFQSEKTGEYDELKSEYFSWLI
jgi:hypothetical protein